MLSPCLGGFNLVLSGMTILDELSFILRSEWQIQAWQREEHFRPRVEIAWGERKASVQETPDRSARFENKVWEQEGTRIEAGKGPCKPC